MSHFVTLPKRTIRLPQVIEDEGTRNALEQPFRYPVEATRIQDSVRKAMIATVPKEHRPPKPRRYGPVAETITRGNGDKIEKARQMTDRIVEMCSDWTSISELDKALSVSRSTVKRHLLVARQDNRLELQSRNNMHYYRKVTS